MAGIPESPAVPRQAGPWRRIGRVALAMAAASLTASVLLHVALGVSMGMQERDWSMFATTNTLITIAFGTIIVGVNAFLPMLLVALVAERYAVRRWWIFTGAGAAAALVSSVGIYLLRLFGEQAINLTLLSWIVAAGAGAGLAYWAVAGRSSGAGR